MKTKIYIDSATLSDIEDAILELKKGDIALSGITTNPSLFATTQTKKVSSDQLWNNYKNEIIAINNMLKKHEIFNIPISIEIYCDNHTTEGEIEKSALHLWQFAKDNNINIHIKIPLTSNGQRAIPTLINKGLSINATLGFDQTQAHMLSGQCASIITRDNQLIYSSFVGRLFDNGIDGISNLLAIKATLENTKVDLLACSFRSLAQFTDSLSANPDIVTVSPKIIKLWSENSFYVPDINNYTPTGSKVDVIDFSKVKIDKDYVNQQTTSGVDKFVLDWDKLVIS